MRKILYTSITLFIVLAIVYLSLTSRSVGVQISHMDKVQHSLAYGVLSFFLTLSLRSWGILRKDIIVSLIICALLGGMLEIIQSRYGRMMEMGDFIADVIGASIGIFLVRISSRISL